MVQKRISCLLVSIYLMLKRDQLTWHQLLLLIKTDHTYLIACRKASKVTNTVNNKHNSRTSQENARIVQV